MTRSTSLQVRALRSKDTSVPPRAVWAYESLPFSVPVTSSTKGAARREWHSPFQEPLVVMDMARCSGEGERPQVRLAKVSRLSGSSMKNRSKPILIYKAGHFSQSTHMSSLHEAVN